MKKLLLICLFLFVSINIIIHQVYAFMPSNTYYPLDVINGAGLYKTPLAAIKRNFPYLILWRDNLVGGVKIELYAG